MWMSIIIALELFFPPRNDLAAGWRQMSSLLYILLVGNRFLLIDLYFLFDKEKYGTTPKEAAHRLRVLLLARITNVSLKYKSRVGATGARIFSRDTLYSFVTQSSNWSVDVLILSVSVGICDNIYSTILAKCNVIGNKSLFIYIYDDVISTQYL